MQLHKESGYGTNVVEAYTPMHLAQELFCFIGSRLAEHAIKVEFRDVEFVSHSWAHGISFSIYLDGKEI